MHFVSLLLAASLALTAPIPEKSISKRVSKLKFFGVNESGPEWGTAVPGVKNTDYVWPTLSTIDTFVSNGMNTFRINILMERLASSSMTQSAFEASYLADLTTTVNYITNKGAYAMINLHNYGRFNSQIITDTAAFQTFWQNLAAKFKSNSLVIFDTNNEFHDMDQSLVVKLNQAAINGIRAAGATSQYIHVEGNDWTGAWTWTTGQNGATMGALTDPQNKIVYQMHQYLDSDGSGSGTTCVSSTIGSQRLAAATAWLRSNGKKGMLGEYAGVPTDSTCVAAIKDMLAYIDKNSDVWYGAAWWAAGPWWGTSTSYSMEPTTGASYALVPTIMAYA